MPTYEYECKECSHSFEVFQAMSDEPLKTCPDCGKEIRRLIFGGTGVIFKGSGFYVTDKNKGRNATAAKSGSKTEGTSSGEAASVSGGTCGAQCPAGGCPAANSTGDSASDTKSKAASAVSA
ncbi:MAG: zinc ribbon domain-containing protein [Treponema sp.]|nr:zinc ribbon domain-containing protein [Treponema sp.]